MFSTFLLLALLFGAFFLAALRGAFFFGSGCLTVSTALPANRLLRRAGADALALAFGLAVLFFLPHRHYHREVGQPIKSLYGSVELLSDRVNHRVQPQ